MRKRLLVIAGVLALVLGLGVTEVDAKPGPTASAPKPHPFGVKADANRFSQVAARSTGGRTDAGAVNGVDMKLAHVDDHADIIAPTDKDASYSYSIGAFDSTGVYWLQFGYIVLGSDGNGWARWFIQVLRRNGSAWETVAWQLSRAGEANPPPACSACSGGSTDGYPFAFTTDNAGRWSFWFDGIRKKQITLPVRDLDPSGIYLIGEATTSNATASFFMSPRVTLRSLSLWSNGPRTWEEAKKADAVYYTSASNGGSCSTHGLAHPPPASVLPNRIKKGDGTPLYPDGMYPTGLKDAPNYQKAHMLGMGISCSWTGPDGALW